jgi:hypothetical protein
VTGGAAFAVHPCRSARRLEEMLGCGDIGGDGDVGGDGGGSSVAACSLRVLLTWWSLAAPIVGVRLAPARWRDAMRDA